MLGLISGMGRACVAGAVALPLAILAAPTFARASYEIDVSNDPQVRDGEPSLGVNPTDRSNLVMGYMKADRGECAVSATFDRGATWKSQVLREITDPVYSFCADPTLVFGADGTVYLAAIAFNQSFQVGHTVVTRSTDGGMHWTPPIEAIGPQSLASGAQQGTTAPIDGFDRPWLAAGKARRTLYLTTMTIFSRPNGTLVHRYLVASHDKGRHWGKVSIVDSPEYPADHWATGTIAVARDGTVAIAYTARRVPEPGMRCPCVVMATTTDGVNFRHRTLPFTDAMLGVSFPEQGELSAVRLVYGPVVAADPTRRGRYAVAVAGWSGLAPYAAGQSGIGPRSTVQAQLFLTGNSGRSWTGPVVLGEDRAKEREHIWLAYSPRGGSRRPLAHARRLVLLRLHGGLVRGLSQGGKGVRSPAKAEPRPLALHRGPRRRLSVGRAGPLLPARSVGRRTQRRRGRVLRSPSSARPPGRALRRATGEIGGCVGRAFRPPPPIPTPPRSSRRW